MTTPRPLCRSTTKTGQPCRNRAAAGNALCGAHGGGQRRVGAPTKLTIATIATIVEAVELGATYEIAAQAAGIHRDTLRGWREQGEADRDADLPTDYADLIAAVDDARARGEVELLRSIRAHAALDWRPAAWLLKVRHPERYVERTRLDVDVQERAQPRDVVPPDPARRATIIDILATATAPPATP